MTRCLPALIALCAVLTPSHAQGTDTSKESRVLQPGAGLEFWASTDSDNIDVVKVLGRALWHFEGRNEFRGIAIERFWFRSPGRQARKQERIYLDLADNIEGNLLWRARVGTDGNNVIGSVTLRDSDWSKEFFLEREIVETPRGVDEGLYYTFVGGAWDIPAGSRDVFNAMVGVQEFAGKNERLHFRGSYVRVIKPEVGLSVQLRGRYFHSTSPGEFDYYSPRNFIQFLPVVQLRRFDSAGWMYLVAVGYGVQKANGTRWQDARLADMRIESPANSRRLQAFGQLQYTNNSLSGGASDYHYFMTRVGLSAGF